MWQQVPKRLVPSRLCNKRRPVLLSRRRTEIPQNRETAVLAREERRAAKRKREAHEDEDQRDWCVGQQNSVGREIMSAYRGGRGVIRVVFQT